MNPFTKSANDAKARGERALARRIITEGKIVSLLIKHAIKSGYVVSVNDGEEWVVRRSKHYPTIIDACFSTDEDYLMIIKVDPVTGALERIGRVALIYGNDGYDVISDYSAPDLDAFSDWIKPVEKYADLLSD